MGTFKVQARSYTNTSVVDASTSYVTTTQVLYTKKITVTGEVTDVLPSQGGSLAAGELYNSGKFVESRVGDQKYVIIASADANNDESVQIWAISRATGPSIANAEILLANLSPGRSIAIPFHTDSGDDARDELPRLVAARTATGSTAPNLEITINY